MLERIKRRLGESLLDLHHLPASVDKEEAWRCWSQNLHHLPANVDKEEACLHAHLWVTVRPLDLDVLEIALFVVENVFPSLSILRHVFEQ